MFLPVFRPSEADGVDAFVALWSRLYAYPDDHLYTENIGRPLTPDRIKALFAWKNGGPISKRKQGSIERHYLDAPERLLPHVSHEAAGALFDRIGGGGAVWGIFFLHCLAPSRFPIFDQHVHRAARLIRGQPPEELDGLSTRAQIARYEDEYLPLWASLRPETFGRALDKALWCFGKAMRTPTGSDLNWPGLITGMRCAGDDRPQAP